MTAFGVHVYLCGCVQGVVPLWLFWCVCSFAAVFRVCVPLWLFGVCVCVCVPLQLFWVCVCATVRLCSGCVCTFVAVFGVCSVEVIDGLHGVQFNLCEIFVTDPVELRGGMG